MREPLTVGRMILKNSGVVLLVVGDRELPRLWLTLEEVFGEGNFLRLLI
ncbi:MULTISPECIES: hypothetical protein [unclassified Actinobaculum]|nr:MULTISPECIES: hypothetical protein [unclassified Actinobaculum]